MRLVLDTNVIVSAFLWGGTPRQLLNLIIEYRVTLLCSDTLLRELEKTLQKPKLQKYIGLTGKTSSQLVLDYKQLVTLVEPALIPEDVVRDVDDLHVLAVAVGGNAVIIVSGDDDLLTLGQYEDIQILKIGAAIDQIKRLYKD